MKSKYIDVSSVVQVIGNIFSNPAILDADDKYVFSEHDFCDELHKIIFGSIYNLHQLGVKEINLNAIQDYLTQRPKKLATYQSQNGAEFLLKSAEMCKPAAFDYYYNRMKKMSLLRGYQANVGMDLSWLYDPDELDSKAKQKQEDWLDATDILDIANLIDDKISSVKMEYVDNMTDSGVQVGKGAAELIERLKANPEMGYPMYGSYVNTITRGARLGKFYLRSAATGVGKTRSMVADACYMGCNKIYNLDKNEWESTGPQQGVLYIATEQPLDEVQTMMLAFLSGVTEEHILYGEYIGDEWDRVQTAIKTLECSKIIFESLPDFSLLDIENTIKRNIRENGVKYIFLDYIHTSMKILEEITKRSGGVRLREDNILFMISIRLKDICTQYDVFILSATQLNGDYREAKEYDQNLLRGAKAIADKIDLGLIMLEVSQEDAEALKPIVNKLNVPMPTVKISCYKNRRGRWKNILMWCVADRGICRINPIFVTQYDYGYIEMEDLKIKVEEDSAFDNIPAVVGDF